MWIDGGYFEQKFWKKPSFNIKFGKKPSFNIKFGKKPILAQNSKFKSNATI